MVAPVCRHYGTGTGTGHPLTCNWNSFPRSLQWLARPMQLRMVVTASCANRSYSGPLHGVDPLTVRMHHPSGLMERAALVCHQQPKRGDVCANHIR
jgi:hypothetical protein